MKITLKSSEIKLDVEDALYNLVASCGDELQDLYCDNDEKVKKDQTNIYWSFDRGDRLWLSHEVLQK